MIIDDRWSKRFYFCVSIDLPFIWFYAKIIFHMRSVCVCFFLKIWSSPTLHTPASIIGTGEVFLCACDLLARSC